MIGLQYFESEFLEVGPPFLEGGADLLVDPDGSAEVDNMVADEALVQVLLHEGLEVEYLGGVPEKGEEEVFDVVLAVGLQAVQREGLPDDSLHVEPVCLLLLVVGLHQVVQRLHLLVRGGRPVLVGFASQQVPEEVDEFGVHYLLEVLPGSDGLVAQQCQIGKEVQDFLEGAGMPGGIVSQVGLKGHDDIKGGLERVGGVGLRVPEQVLAEVEEEGAEGVDHGGVDVLALVVLGD